ncbi:hypothetical protein FRZ03_27765 [Streptomyces misionensis]|uniref:Uncharacterized protein n=1 Tax=Streptomyces misionensis TaxID=67331 RepID=A0A5C6J360_9ACTN|nr:hypothetical protein [Streptomyces misionensis]TWV34897.1 hypothetical protein FRZ03_27765 [Streptomyces misionensis]
MTNESASRSATVDKHPHKWVVAEIQVDETVARIADFRGSFKTRVEQRINALDTYCKNCRRPFADVSSYDCQALLDNRHLIGEGQSVRAKHKPAPTAPPGTKPSKAAPTAATASRRTSPASPAPTYRSRSATTRC